MTQPPLFLDIETWSPVDLTKTGVHAYAADPETRITVVGYALGNDPVEVWSYHHAKIPEILQWAIADNSVVKWAHNAEFERVLFSNWAVLPSGSYLDPASWRCSAVMARSLGLPARLEWLAKVLKTDQQKEEVGKKLMKVFAIPPGKPNHEHPDWQLWCDYCAADVESMRDCVRLMLKAPVL